MRKYVLTLALVSASLHNYSSQTGVGSGLVTTPIASPSMTAMSRYSDIPVSLASGVPAINFPLGDKAIEYPLSLSYSLDDQLLSEGVGDVGAGWSFFGTGVIYKKIINGLDECYDQPTWPGHLNNEFDDLYYYNFPGGSGKFRIKRDIVNNTFSLINLAPDNLKIEYVRNSNTATFKADSFTVTTDNGYKYVFSEFDIAKYGCPNYGDMALSFKPAYFLTQIINPLGIEVAGMQYDKKEENGNKYCKLKSVTTPAGTVLLNYVYDATLLETVNEPYSLQKITVMNPAGQIIYSYDFSYSIADKPAQTSKRKRILNNIRKSDRNGAKIEQTTFIYSDTGGLSRIVSPTGGTTEYIYEQNQKFFDFNDPAYLDGLEKYGYNPDLQYPVSYNTINVNTDQGLVYNFTIPGDVNKQKYIRFDLNVDLEYPDTGGGGGTGLPGTPLALNATLPPNLRLTLKRGSEVILNSISLRDRIPGKPMQISNKPGNYTFEFQSIGGTKGAGSISVSGLAFKPGPYRNSTSASGYRIKNTKFYKNSTDTAPERTITYEYDSFDQANSTSGYEFYNESDSYDATNPAYIIYKNVKVSETGKGYVKNRFKTAEDYPKYQNGGTTLEPTYFWPYYRVTKQGLPFKKEVYDEQNNLLASEENTFELDYYSTDEYALHTTGGKIFSRPAYIKKSVNKSTVYYKDGKKLENSSETQFEGIRFKPVYTKSVVDEDVIEKFMTYPVNLPEYSHLEAAGITGSPVIVEGKQNGKTLSKAVTRYTAPSLLPTSVVAVNTQGDMREEMRMEVYDDRGNLVQYRGLNGQPVTLIYGYNKTQVIARIEGATYAEVSPHASEIITASNADYTGTSGEPALITALENFRKKTALANYPVTMYTYDPLVGLTNMISPSGMRETYEYDTAGRLKTTRRTDLDSTGAAVSKKTGEYQYNYKQ